MTRNEFVESVRAELLARLRDPALETAAQASDATGFDADARARFVVAAEETDTAGARAIGERMSPLLEALPPLSLERLLLAEACLRSIDSLGGTRVPPRVRHLTAEGFLFITAEGAPGRGGFDARLGHPHFAGMCKVATLRRFAAGQFDFVTSGFPRSWLFHVERRALPRVLGAVARMGGFRPVLSPHYSTCRPHRLRLAEQEVEHSYLLFARTMLLRPEMRGFVSSSWYYSPDTHRESPHLAWLNRVFLENGGVVARMGASDIDTGVLHNSRQRRQAFEAGRFRPTTGVVLWPRADALRWAQAHPDWDRVAEVPAALPATPRPLAAQPA